MPPLRRKRRKRIPLRRRRHQVRPKHGEGDLKTWHDYYFLFDNPKGPHTEYWQHVLGCRHWFKLTRNTATNEIGEAS